MAALGVLRDKLVERHVALKAFKADDPRLSGKEYKISGSFESGLSQENAKKIAKIIRDEGPKGIKTQVQGEEVRVSSKSRDDLQSVMSLLKEQDLDVALQFTNYR